MRNSIAPERPWAVGPKHSAVPSATQLSDTPFDWVLVRVSLFGDVDFYLVLAHHLLDVCFPSNLFSGTIIYEFCRGSIHIDKFVKPLMAICLSLYRIDFSKKLSVAEYLTVFSPYVRMCTEHPSCRWT